MSPVCFLQTLRHRPGSAVDLVGISTEILQREESEIQSRLWSQIEIAKSSTGEEERGIWGGYYRLFSFDSGPHVPFSRLLCPFIHSCIHLFIKCLWRT